MAIDYGKALERSLKFSLDPKRWLPFFILDFAFFSLMLFLAITGMPGLVSILLSGTLNPAVIGSFIWIFLGGLLLFAIWMLIRLWVTGAVIHQSYREKETRKSWHVSCNRYLSLLLASVIMGVISSVLSAVPFIGWILGIIASIAFFFALPAIIVKKRGFWKGICESCRIFRAKPLRVLLIWLLTSVIAILIVLAFSLPSLALLWGLIFANIAEISGSVVMARMLFFLLSNMGHLLLVAGIFIIGTSISTTFVLKASTEFYLQCRKKALGMF